MITEDYVSFEVARLLKDKGFDQNCATYYLDGQVWRHCHGEVIPKSKQIYAAPTQSVAMKWLREVHKIYIDINIHIILAQWAGYDINIYATNTKDCLLDKVISYKGSKYTSYEQACEAAIKYCLENLI